MKDIRRALSVIGLAASLVVAAAASSAPVNADPGAFLLSEVEHRAPAVKSVVRRYGGTSVRQDAWDQVVKIAFRGRAGDVVGARTRIDTVDRVDATACQHVRLTTRAGDVVRQGRSELWSLPATDRYVVTYRQECVFGPTSGDGAGSAYTSRLAVQLLKVRTHQLRPGDGLLTLPVKRGYVDVAELRLTSTLPVVVRALADVAQGQLTGEIDRIVTPSATAEVRKVGQVVDGDECNERAPLTLQVGERLTGSVYYAGANGLDAEPAPLHCDRDARFHVAERGDTFWFFNQERPLEVEALRSR